MSPLRILFIAPYVPSRVRVRSFNLIKQLAARGHRVTLCAVSSAGAPSVRAREIDSFCEAVEVVPLTRMRSWWNCARALPGGIPLQASYGYSPRLQARVDQLLGRVGGEAFDVVHIEHLRAALFAWSVHGPHVFDAVDCISQLFAQTVTQGSGRMSRWSARVDLPRTRTFERRLLGQFKRILTTTGEERDALAGLFSTAAAAEDVAKRISVLPAGIDLEYFQPVDAVRDPATLVFVGRMSYHANVSAIDFLVREILPHVWRVRPEVRVNVVGEDPQPRLRRWAAASGGRISVTGTVPDVRPYVAQATLAVCPVPYAVGIQNKVLEAMAMATPVVCTAAPARALSATDGEELLVARDAPTFAGQVLSLLDDAPRRQRLGVAGRRYVERAHDWRSSGDRLEAIYREEIARQR